MKNSIRTRLILVLTGFIVVFIAVNLLMNISFLERFYTHQKTRALGDIYNQVYEVSANIKDDMDYFSDPEIYYALDRLGANNGVTLYLFSITNDGFFNIPKYNFKFPEVEGNSYSFNIVKEQLDNYLNDYYGWSNLSGNYQMIESTNAYRMYKIYDERIGSNYLELFGMVNKTTFIYLRANYQNMKESVAIANRFITYIGFIAIIIGAFFMFFICKKFTDPILKLAYIANRMAHLDFEAKYEVNSDDEVGQLGESMNLLSERLETTISELKSANNELQCDIERKIQIDELRQEFLSNVSHELKTPIALIQGYAEGLQDNIMDDLEDRRFYCDVIMDEAAKMNRMVRRLLDLNQLEFGTEKPNMERFDMVEVIKSVVASADILFKQKNVVLNLYEPSAVYVWADPFLVEEVLTNYVSNALNHLKHPNHIEIYTQKHGSVVRVAVHNTGDSIPEEELDKVWVKFYKIDKARTREYGGNGIGLSIVKAIMNSFNQACGVRNTETGVEFWFELDTSNEVDGVVE